MPPRPLPFGMTFLIEVLVDAPCSGTGTIDRGTGNRLSPGPRAAGRTAPDYKLQILSRVYCQCSKQAENRAYLTCSLEPEENEEVIAATAQNRGETGSLPALLAQDPR